MTQENKYRKVAVQFIDSLDQLVGIDTSRLKGAIENLEYSFKQIAIDAKREGMEEAAKICDLKAEEVHEEGITTHGLGFMFQDYKECAESIRAEKEKL